ncbi:MAG: type IX secretion system outer membrane channel protein PorV [Ignavibacteriales bacterium]
MKKFLFVLAIFMSINLLAQNPNLGTAGGQFLQIPVSARAEAMGGAVVGFTDDASSVFWNPAGITQVKNVEVFLSFFNWFEMFDYYAASVAYNANEYGSIAASMIVFTTGKMEVTDEKNPNGTGRYFDAGDFALGLTYAKYLTDRFRFGITAKYINQQIWDETANGFAFDVGTQYQVDFQNMTIAMSMTNFGGDMQFDGSNLDITHLKDENFPISRLTPARLKTEEYPLPLHFQVGIAMDLLQTDIIKIRGGLDATHPNDNKERVLVGAEISFYDRFYLRGGYKYNYDDQKFAFGAGTSFPLSDSFVFFDYAYSIYDILPNVHRLSLRFTF